MDNDVLLELIASRKLSIAFSKFNVQVVDGTSKMSYIEYHAVPTANAQKALVHPTRQQALEVALTNCFNNVTSTSGLVMSPPENAQ